MISKKKYIIDNWRPLRRLKRQRYTTNDVPLLAPQMPADIIGHVVNIPASSETVHIINDIPDAVLVGIASYLAKPSVLLFAITMNPSDSQQQTETSKAILSSTNWNVLDFSDIEKSLASKLSDNDID